MSATHTFKLLTGVEAEIKEITGKELEILSRTVKGENETKKFNLLLASILVRVGGNHAITEDFTSNMVTEDRRWALAVARQFSMSFEETFRFRWEYPNGTSVGVLEQEIPLPAGNFPSTPYKTQWAEYPDPKSDERWVKLEIKGTKYKWKLLDGGGEAIGAGTPKDKISTKTLMDMRQVSYFDMTMGKGQGVWVRIDYPRLGLGTLGTISASFKEHEGKVDTEVMFDHPDPTVEPHLRKVVVDLISTPTFFFPSGI